MVYLSLTFVLLLWAGTVICVSFPDPVTIPLNFATLTPDRSNDQFFISIGLGTPPQPLTVFLDSGSNLLAVPGPDCESNGCVVPGYFDGTRSNSYDPLACDDDTCPGACAASDPTQCGSSITYADQSGISGRLVSDVLTIGPLNASVSFTVIDNIVGNFQSVPSQGIFGIDYDSPSCAATVADASPICSPITALLSANHMYNAFSICQGDLDFESQVTGLYAGVGVFTLGGWDPLYYIGQLSWTPVSVYTYYVVQMLDLRLGGNSLRLPYYVFNDGSDGQTIVDNGTAELALPQTAWEALRDAIIEILGGCNPFPDEGDNCCPRRLFSQNFGALSLTVVLNGVELSVTPKQYLTCGPVFGCATGFCQVNLRNQSDDEGTILGQTVTNAYYVAYDRQGARVGFAPAVCNRTCDLLASCAECTSSRQCMWSTAMRTCMLFDSHWGPSPPGTSSALFVRGTCTAPSVITSTGLDLVCHPMSVRGSLTAAGGSPVLLLGQNLQDVDQVQLQPLQNSGAPTMNVPIISASASAVVFAAPLIAGDVYGILLLSSKGLFSPLSYPVPLQLSASSNIELPSPASDGSTRSLAIAALAIGIAVMVLLLFVCLRRACTLPRSGVSGSTRSGDYVAPQYVPL